MILNAIIMRGVPGSGKSTLARKLIAGFTGEVCVHSTDDLRYQEGRYVYDPKRNAELHAQNLANFIASLHARVPLVICDNTNIKLADFEPYRYAAVAFGYRVTVVTVECNSAEACASRNIHGVPLEAILSMLERFEVWGRDSIELLGPDGPVSTGN